MTDGEWKATDNGNIVAHVEGQRPVLVGTAYIQSGPGIDEAKARDEWMSNARLMASSKGQAKVIADLRALLAHLQRKIAHGCTEATCSMCD